MNTYNYKKAGGNTRDFNECHDLVRTTVANMYGLKEYDILSFSKRDEVMFLNKNRIKQLWYDFKSKNTIECGLESTMFDDDYGNEFGLFCISRCFENEANVRWFYPLIEYAFGLYGNEELK